VFTGELGIADPVSELKSVSHDPSLKHLIRLRDGRRLTALDLQWAYLERARSFMDTSGGPDEMTAEIREETRRVSEIAKKTGVVK